MTSTPAPTPRSQDTKEGILLLLGVFVIAVCGLIYELIAGTLSSYLLGDSVTQFSLTIGLFMTAMGIGSWLSRFFRTKLLACFIAVELLIALIGGMTALAGFALFAYTELYTPGLMLLVVIIGALVGIEIPLVIRILENTRSLRITVANVLSVDYIGAFAAALLFPFILLPELGLVRASMTMGLMNVFVAFLLLWRFAPELGTSVKWLTWASSGVTALLLTGIATAGWTVSTFEDAVYQDTVVLARTTPHQRVIVTKWRDDIRLFLNGHLQFSSVDEYRYHEALVHPAMSLAERRTRVLILGGGDGLAVREILKYKDVERVDLIDLDQAVTDLFTSHPLLSQINGGTLKDKRVFVSNLDAMKFLEDTSESFDVILLDLPDPSEPSLGKLYSRPFYRLLGRRLRSGGLLVTQATSPFRSREAFWCIHHTIEASTCTPGAQDTFKATPYHTVVPTFGTWGFILAGRRKPDPAKIKLTVPLKFLTQDSLPGFFAFPKDMSEVKTGLTELDSPEVSRLYREGYHRHF